MLQLWTCLGPSYTETKLQQKQGCKKKALKHCVEIYKSDLRSG